MFPDWTIHPTTQLLCLLNCRRLPQTSPAMDALGKILVITKSQHTEQIIYGQLQLSRETRVKLPNQIVV